MNQNPPGAERRRRLVTRTLPLALAAAVSFVAGAATGADDPPEKLAAERFVDAWADSDFATMYRELTPAARDETSRTDFANAYLDAEETSTLDRLEPGEASDPEDPGGEKVVRVPIRVGTVAFGDVEAEVEIPFDGEEVAWAPHLVFPGLREGERLDSRIRLAGRAPILARDGTPLAEGPVEERSSPLGSTALDVAGEVGEAEPEDAATLARQGFPRGTPVGVSGLEQAFNSRLAGRPGGSLLAVPEDGGEPRVLAESEPVRGERVRTTIDPDLQEAAVAALAGRLGGIAVLDARTGDVRALAGSAFSVPRPPGSAFKIITTTAALQEGKVTMDEEFPVLDGVNVGGREILNANGEFCGGDFRESFAHSCNSVFAPLGVEVGEKALVDTAKRFGFNEEPQLYEPAAVEAIDPPKPSIPREVGDDLDVGVSAIGQGEVLATPLVMASVAQTVANDGVREPNSIVAQPELGPAASPHRVMSKRIAAQLTDLMEGVVEFGTGTAGAIPEAQVAGKTGTAELGPKPGQENLPPGTPVEQYVDAWFTAFAPSDRPRLVVAVNLIDADAAGGEVAAPAAAQILSAGL
ncbi:MAG TPA: penicillin-binding transpeptidase domain-containing protein [Solirubrobacterales bacterium]|nr:penicillin-binding transpeptidase domain-containing protein [Solirubrobacterales bacterium]